MSFVLTVSWRYFSAKKNEKLVSFIAGFSIFGVMIGVAALIVVMSVMNGFHRELVRNIIGLDGEIIIRANLSNTISNYQATLDKILELPAVKAGVPLVEGQALIVSAYASAGVLIKGVNTADLTATKPKIMTKLLASSNPDSILTSNNILIGEQLAMSLGVKLGDTLKLVSANTIATIFGNLPRSKDFIVAGIFASGMYDYDSATVLMNLEIAAKFFNFPIETISAIEVYTTDFSNTWDTAQSLNTLLGPKFLITNWQQKYANFLNAIQVEKVAMFAILSLIIIVAAFNIVSSLFILVKDRTKDIAILKTIGASASAIMLIFMINGLLIGIIGTTMGIIVGIAITYNIENLKHILEQISGVSLFDSAVYFLDHLPVHLLISNVIMISLMSLGLCFLASLYPAYKAAYLNPVEALRYE